MHNKSTFAATTGDHETSVVNQFRRADRDLELHGLMACLFSEFGFFVDDEGDVLAELRGGDYCEVLDIDSLAFESLLKFFAKSKGIELTEDEWISTLIRIERLVKPTMDVGLCEECAACMKVVA
jgi:hypothetical protein